MTYSSQDKITKRKELADKLESVDARVEAMEDRLLTTKSLADEVLRQEKDNQKRVKELQLLQKQQYHLYENEVDSVQAHRRRMEHYSVFSTMLMALGFLALSIAITLK